MTADEYRAALTSVGVLSLRQAGAVLGFSQRQSARYRSGQIPIPVGVERLVLLLVLHPEQVAEWLPQRKRRKRRRKKKSAPPPTPEPAPRKRRRRQPDIVIREGFTYRRE
jgi:hypothetical protein